jgi:hypothetical protein
MMSSEERRLLQERIDLARRARLALADDHLIVGRRGTRAGRILLAPERQEQILSEARYPRKLTKMEL